MVRPLAGTAGETSNQPAAGASGQKPQPETPPKSPIHIRNERWHVWTAGLVTFLFFAVQIAVFMLVVPLAEEERVHSPGGNRSTDSHGTIKRALADLGLEGQTFYNNATKMFCEDIRDPKADGGHEGRYVLPCWAVFSREDALELLPALFVHL